MSTAARTIHTTRHRKVINTMFTYPTPPETFADPGIDGPILGPPIPGAPADHDRKRLIVLLVALFVLALGAALII